MLPLWPIWCNQKLINCLENFEFVHVAIENDPWLGANVSAIKSRVDVSKPWYILLDNSVHINWLVNLDRGWRLIPEKVLPYINKRPLIINMSADPFRRYEESVVDQLSELCNDFVVLSGDATYYYQPKKHVCYFPFWYLHQKYRFQSNFAIDKPRQYVISCMNKVSRYHRIENFIKLQKKSYFDQMLFGMLFDYNRTQVARNVPRQFYNLDIIKEFESQIPAEKTKMTDKQDVHSINLPAYYDSYANLVTETSIYKDTIFVSEKSWKPFMSGQFGLWLSNPGTVDFFRDLGFDVFDDIFQDHFYDKETDLNKRIDNLHSIIDDYMQMNSSDMFEKTLPRRKANLELFYSEDLEQKLTNQTKQYQL